VGPQLKDNGPQKLSDIVMPEAYNHTTLDVEGHRIEIVDAAGLANRRYLWAPELHGIFGGVLVSSGLHVWTADTPTAESRAAWVKTLDAMAARKPRLVIPGHLAPGAATDVTAIHYTRDYLLAFEEELPKAADSGALIAAMTRRYPNVGGVGSLQLGAKVAKGEMKWG
jgi:glyoxylase-like metal-dependent hydrolase (beta-lactamase superfamily II)